MADEKKSREDLLNDLEKATKRLAQEKAAKKTDSKAHNDNIGDIEDEIDEIMSQLGNV